MGFSLVLERAVINSNIVHDFYRKRIK